MLIIIIVIIKIDISTLQEAISRSGWLHNPEFWQSQQERSDQKKQQSEEYQEGGNGGSEGEHVYSLADFTLGPVIDKGCNAVVYAARWKTGEQEGLGHSVMVTLWFK